MNPNYWGKYYWKVIHITALGYPISPTKNDEKNYHQFFKSIGQILPCSKCRKNYERHFENIPIAFFLENNKSLFKWTVHLHNTVNKELGKPQWNVEFAESFYKTHQKNDKDGNGNEINTGKNVNCHVSKIMIFINILAIMFFILMFWLKLS